MRLPEMYAQVRISDGRMSGTAYGTVSYLSTRRLYIYIYIYIYTRFLFTRTRTILLETPLVHLPRPTHPYTYSYIYTYSYTSSNAGGAPLHAGECGGRPPRPHS